MMLQSVRVCVVVGLNTPTEFSHLNLLIVRAGFIVKLHNGVERLVGGDAYIDWL